MSALLVLLPDLLDLSVSVSVSPSPLESRAEFRGLSVFAPGIFDRRVLKDRADSLVSDFEKDGKDWRASGPPELVGREALPSLDGWLPIASVCVAQKAGKFALVAVGGQAKRRARGRCVVDVDDPTEAFRCTRLRRAGNVYLYALWLGGAKEGGRVGQGRPRVAWQQWVAEGSVLAPWLAIDDGVVGEDGSCWSRGRSKARIRQEVWSVSLLRQCGKFRTGQIRSDQAVSQAARDALRRLGW